MVGRWIAGPIEGEGSPTGTPALTPLVDHTGRDRCCRSSDRAAGTADVLAALRLRWVRRHTTHAELDRYLDGAPTRDHYKKSPSAACRLEHQLQCTILCDPSTMPAYGIRHWNIERVLPEHLPGSGAILADRYRVPDGSARNRPPTRRRPVAGCRFVIGTNARPPPPTSTARTPTHTYS